MTRTQDYMHISIIWTPSLLIKLLGIFENRFSFHFNAFTDIFWCNDLSRQPLWPINVRCIFYLMSRDTLGGMKWRAIPNCRVKVSRAWISCILSKDRYLSTTLWWSVLIFGVWVILPKLLFLSPSIVVTFKKSHELITKCNVLLLRSFKELFRQTYKLSGKWNNRRC